MRRFKVATALAVVVASATLPVVLTASPAAAAPQCVLALYYQNNYVPGSGDLSPNCTMGYGAYGNAVRELQRSLNTCYRKGLTVDGDFGGKTRDALKSVQGSLKISQDGVYGPQTARAMNHIIAEASGCDRISF
ncbi:Putative peptidoglycan binding domain-containing protein [Micromonospora coriariae]|uniref:Putative peptidoglycan binding domain-containing protein n=1 Tax=Micromonospora coriariae TaxID=285665 RepID=A0A1C4V9T3_9ACTN|nr:peptidoglycan-binding domain-containing protein [Micromonospora coriariae]SCE80783.1 Putative peptidoglycan binding domain-containing protein [Micromonospora coriariae]